MTPADEAEALRQAAKDVLAQGGGRRIWRLCAHAWLTARADRLAPKTKTKQKEQS